MGDLEHALSAYENALRHNPVSVSGLTQVAGIARIKENYPKVSLPFSADSLSTLALFAPDAILLMTSSFPTRQSISSNVSLLSKKTMVKYGVPWVCYLMHKKYYLLTLFKATAILCRTTCKRHTQHTSKRCISFQTQRYFHPPSYCLQAYYQSRRIQSFGMELAFSTTDMDPSTMLKRHLPRSCACAKVCLSFRLHYGTTDGFLSRSRI